MRLRRNCSTLTAFKLEARELRNCFLERGYPDYVLCEAYNYASARECTSLLTPREDRPENKNIFRLIASYDEAEASVKHILCQHWKILLLDPDIADTVGPVTQVTYRRGMSVRDHLVRSHAVPPSP